MFVRGQSIYNLPSLAQRWVRRELADEHKQPRRYRLAAVSRSCLDRVCRNPDYLTIKLTSWTIQSSDRRAQIPCIAGEVPALFGAGTYLRNLA